MKQFSVKNDHAAELLEAITHLTGKGKTEVIVSALEAYQAELLRAGDAQRALDAIRKTVHPHLLPEYRGRAPSKAELEEMLGMP